MKTVTFETAKALKEVGFPQPELKSGQFWYHNLFAKDIAVLIGNTLYFVNGTGFSTIGSNRDLIFAPTADDLLQGLQDCSLTFYGGKYLVLERDTGNGKSDWGDNPAELAAGVWLEVRNGELINSENGDDRTIWMPKDGTYIMTFDPETTSIT